LNRRRPGYALIELLIVITVTAVMLTLCAGMIHLLLKLDRTGRTASEQAADLARLARDFRADAHASLKVSNQAGSDRMIFSVDAGRTVEYQIRPNDILRTVREGEKVRRFETYRRPARTSVRFAGDSAGPRPFIIMMIDRPSDGRDDSFYRDYRIEAEIGKNQRLNPRAE
jgi:type II secretory pathway component PulJ